MFFWKIEKRFELWSTGSEVNTLTPADVSGLTVWSINTKTHKIDGPTFKLFSIVQVKDKLKETHLFFRKDVPNGWLNVNSFKEEKLTWRFYSATEALSTSINVFI